MEDVVFEYHGKGNNKTATIVINNECTIYNVENIHKKIKDKIKSEKIVKVQVNNVSNIDLAGVQLLISLKKVLVKALPGIEMEYLISDDLKNILTNNGLDEIIHN